MFRLFVLLLKTAKSMKRLFVLLLKTAVFTVFLEWRLFVIMKMTQVFLCGAICWGTLFSVRNAKTGPNRARVHLESSNFVYRHIFCSL